MNVFTGSVPEAVDRYADIPVAVRVRLRERMERRDYDDVAEISRGRITGQREYADLREMHFGAGRVCRTVDRDGWSEQMRERGLVYCEDRHCIIVPTVCRNVARVTRLGIMPTPPFGGGTPDSVAQVPLIAVPTMEPSGSGGTGPASFIAQSSAFPGGTPSVTGAGMVSAPLAWTPAYTSVPSNSSALAVAIVPEPPVWLLGVAGILGLIGFKGTRRDRHIATRQG